MLTLDSLMIRVAALRSKSLKLLRHKSVAQLSYTNRLKEIALEAHCLDVALAAWSQSIPEAWKFSTLSSTEGFGQTTSGILRYGSHSYTTYGHAAIWNRYRGTHIVVNSIRMRFLSLLAQCTFQEASVNLTIDTCQKNINSLATDLCRSVPFFFSSCNSPQDGRRSGTNKVDKDTSCIDREVVPKVASFLVWPIAVAVCTDAVPTALKEWLRCKLKTIASVVGNAVLQSVAETGEFEF